ncbi:hypothetical protein HPG69_013855, partial [Diceros bicornis minor]
VTIIGTPAFSHCITLQVKRRERNTMEKFSSIWKNTSWPGDGDDFHYITQRSQKFTFLNHQISTQLMPLTVVLHGPAGVGKTTLAKKWMLDWTQDHIMMTFNSTFYLSCKELNHKGADGHEGVFEEQLVKDAMTGIKEISIHLTNTFEMMQSSFCLKHCQNLQKISLQVEKGLFLENNTASESDTWVERSQCDHHSLRLWTDLCSVFSSNKNLSFLDVSQSFLSHSSVRILCEQITHVICPLQKVVTPHVESLLFIFPRIKNISPADAYRDLCLAFIGKKTLTHLILEGDVHGDKMLLLLLCETLKHSRCNLQYLRLGSCSDTTKQRDDLSLGLEINQSLRCLDLTASELLDEGVKLLCTTLRHPRCFLQKLSLEDCHLTEACCKELSSTLIVNQRLTHLCLANNNLGDGGVKLLCEGLGYPECQLQTLVLWHCNITRHGCKLISKLLQGDSSLTNLDLGLNPIATGLWFLCEALKKPNCKLKYLGLWGCSITPFCCQDLASALISNQRLETLDLGQNILGKNGIMMLFEALKQNDGPLKTLRLKIDESSVEIQKLLDDVKDSNPKLTIECTGARTTRSSCCDFLS